jgi:hypothetical protein
MKRFVLHGLGITGAFLASLALYQVYGGSPNLATAAAETVTGVGAIWVALAALG